MATPLVVSEVAKSFTMHLRDGIKLPVVSNVSFSVAAGECVVLGGPSGIGKSSLLKMIYGNYAVDTGQILVKHQDPHRRSRHHRSAHGHRRPAPHARLCQPVPAHRAARRGASMSSPSRWSPVVDEGRKRRAKRRPSCWPSSTCRKRSGSCRPPLSPAASSSASTSPAASSPSTRSCCSTSRRHRSTPRTAPSSSR
jgi:energy-coupling factor transporter ATP-binding protein EcfA2